MEHMESEAVKKETAGSLDDTCSTHTHTHIKRKMNRFQGRKTKRTLKGGERYNCPSTPQVACFCAAAPRRESETVWCQEELATELRCPRWQPRSRFSE